MTMRSSHAGAFSGYVALLVLLSLAAFWPATALAQHTSALCSAQAASVTAGGTISINISACENRAPNGSGLGGLGPVDGGSSGPSDMPNHGTASTRRVIASNPTSPWILDYTHNGTSGIGATDVFELTDGSLNGDGDIRFTITINAAAIPSVSIAVNPASVLENGATNLRYTVTRSLNLASATSVNLSLSGTATSGTDYTGAPATINIPAGTTTATFDINPTADSTLEPDETVIFTVAAGTGYTVGSPSSATGTIQNDENPCVGISFPYTLAGANNLARVANLRAAIECANVNGASADVINLNNQSIALEANNVYAFYAGPTGLPQITSGVLLRNGTLLHDYSAGGTLFRTFDIAAAGTLTLTNVVLEGDSAPTPGGAFYNRGTLNVSHTRISGYSTGNRGGVLFNDAGATANFSNALLHNNNAVFAHAIDNAGTVTIINSTFDKHVSISNFGSILTGTGYVVRNSILWNPGSGPIQIDAGNTVSNSIVRGGYAGGTSILSTNPLFVNEGGNDFRLANASPAVDAGNNSNTTAAALTTDLDGNPRFYNDTGVTDTGTGTPPIVDLGAYEKQTNSPLTAVSIAVSPTSVLEDGATNLTYTITRNPSLPTPTTINISVSGTATSGSDYGGAVATIVIPANATTATFTIDPTADTTVEPDETVIMTVAPGTAYTVGSPSSVTATIQNDDADPCAAVSFPYTLPNNLPATLIQAIECANANGTADTINLNGQTVTLIASYATVMGSNIGLPQINTTMTIRNGTITRSGVTPFRFFRNTSILRLIDLTLSNGDSQAEGGAIYNFGSTSALELLNSRVIGNTGTFGGAIFIPAGSNVAIINTLIAGNRANSAGGGIHNRGILGLINSTVSGNFTTDGVAGGGGIANSGGSISLDNTIVFGNEAASFPATNEISGTISLSNNSLVGVDPSFVAPLDASNTAPTTSGDYRLANSSVAIDAGDNNLIPGGVTTDIVGNPRRYNDTGVADTGVGTAPIVDIGAYEKQTNSPLTTVSIAVSPISVLEDGTNNLTYTVTRNENLPTPTTINISVSGTATSSSDYVGAVATIVIPANATTATFTIDPTADTTVEPDETVIMTVASGTGYTVGSPSSATATIQNDDADPCAAVSFPYTLAGADNTARVANLRSAIQCANLNGTADTIDMNGLTVTLSDSVGNFFGTTGLPQVTTALTVRNGTITRSGPNEFRFFSVSSAGNLTLRDLTLTNGGGATYLSNGGSVATDFTSSVLNVVNSTISGSRNDSLNFGSAIASNGTLTVVNSNITGGGFGNGAIAASNGPVLIQNTLIAGNSAGTATNSTGGLRVANALSVNVINSTIVGNYAGATGATRSGGIVAETFTVNLTVRNSIVWGNRNSGNTAPQISNLSSGTSTVTNSLIEGGFAGGSSIVNSDPLFLTPLIGSPTPSTAGNFQLGTLSPAIDAGANANVPVDTFDVDGDSSTSDEAPDLAGSPRRYNDTGVVDTGSGTAPIVDLGAYEKQTDSTASQLTLTKTASGTSFAVGTPASFTLQLSNTGTSATTAVSTITDPIPAGLTIGTLPAGCTAAGQTVTCTRAAGLTAGNSSSFVIPVTATLAAAASITNTATVSGGGDSSCPAATRCSSSVTVTVTGTCAGFAFPYTLAGADNTARVANLRSAIQCANLNSTADSIDLNGQTVTLSDSFGDFFGTTGLPQVTTALTVRNGTITRSGPNEFRFFRVSSAGNLTLRDLTLTNGGGTTYLSNGGSVATDFTTSVLNVVDSTISGSRNDSLNGGSAIASSGTLTVVNSNITGGGFGNGAIAASNGPILIQNTLIAGNSSGTATSSAGGLRVRNALSVNVINSTIVGNYTGATDATRSGGIVADTFTVNLTVRNSIVWGNRNSGNTAPQISNLTGGTTTVSNSLIEGGFAGGSNIVSSDPLFLTPLIGSPTPSTAGNFQLGNLSPAIDAGANANVPVDTFDIDGDSNASEDAPDLAGNPRRYNDAGVVDTGTGTAPIVDLGAFEKQTDSLPAVSIAVSPTSVSEDAAANLDYTVTRSISLPTATTVDISTSGSATAGVDYTGAVTTVVIPANALNAIITINPTVDGMVEPNETVILTVESGSGYTVGSPASATGTIQNDDTAGITVTPTAGLTTSEAGGTATFTVVLNSQPTADVSIGLSSNDTSEGTVAPTSLTFTTANWNTARTVTVTGVDDAIVDGDVAYTIVTAAATSTDTAYNGINAADVSVTNTDNDVAGITVSPTAGLTTTETGGTATFTVLLNTQPTADVSIGLSSSDTSEGAVAPTSLTFTSANWNVARTVTVTGVDDLIVDGNVGYTIVTAAATSTDTAYNGINAADVSVTNTDNDVAGITVSPTAGLTTSEAGGTATFTVVLNTQPTADVLIGLSSNDTSEGTVLPTSLTFTTANWNTARTVTVTGVDDLIVDSNVAYTIVTAAATSTDSAYNGINPADVSVTNTDNDVAGITVSPTAGLTTSEAGGTATFTVVLNTQPTGDVSIGLSSSDTTEGTVLPTSLVFTTANWNVARTVTVTGVDDAIVDGNVAYLILTAAATSTDTAYNGINAADVSVTNTDNDVAGITVSPTAGLTTSEAGGTATFTVVLNTQPTADVSIGLSSSDTTEGTVLPTSLVFTPANWNVARTVTVTGVDDLIVDGNVAYSIVTAAATSTDTAYNGINAEDVSVANTDNDVAGITVSPTAGLTTSETGGTATFTVVLNSQPTANVSVGLSSSDTSEGTVAPTSLTFTAANWNTARTVTVTGVDDLIVDGNVGYTIVTATATSADTAYNGINPADVSVTNTDNDVAGITVSPTAGLSTSEAGGTATFTVVLNTQPTADVSIGLSSSDTSEGTVAPTSLTFTTANWNVARTVTVTGVDDLIVDGNVGYTIVTAAATSTDTAYNGINPADVSVTNTDNDVAGITVSPTAGLTTSEAGGTATFTVVLNTQPTADVSIGLSSSDLTEGTVLPTSLVFTTANWNVARTVTVTGVDDLIVDGNVAYTILTAAATSTDTAYNGINPADVSVTNTDNDVAGITVSPTAGLTTTETGGTATFTVVLNTQPTSDVSISLSSSDLTEGTVSPTSLVFTPANWNTARTVTVTGVDDLTVDGNVAYTILTAAATSTDTAYNGINAADVSVTNTDNDVAGITVSPTAGLTTSEAGGTATFTVVLNTQPTADVSISLSSSDTTEGTVLPTSLVFTTANWNTAQTVTVTGIDDAIVDGNVGYTIVTAAATSTDTAYSGINPADVSVTNTDNDVAGITVSPTAGLTTSEAGGTATFTVVLNTQPTADVSIGLSSSDTTEGTVLPTSLVFTTANWNTAQTVTVTGIDDAIVDGNVGYTIVTAAATSTDTAYNGINPADVSVTNTDNDVAGITVSPTAGLETTETGGTATFTLVLNTQPTADVSIGLSSSDTTEGTVSPTSLTFTTANWNVAQTVTVTGIDDAIVDGNVAYTIVTAAATSTDTAYAGINAADVSVTNTDNDVAGITVSPTAGLTTTETGGTATFTVALNTQPTADVLIGLSSNDTSEGTVSPTSLVFTTANWNTARTVTVTGVDDAIVDGNVAYTIVTAAATSTDNAYNGIDAANVSVSNTDNDTAGITVTQSGGGTAVIEGGASDTYTLVLTSQPTADVTVMLSGGAQVTATPSPVIFTSGNWNLPQTVTVSAVDDLIVEGTHNGSVTHTVTSADAAYDGRLVDTVSVTITDNDAASVLVTESGGSTAATEGGATDTIGVVLSSQPLANVTVTVTPNAEVTASPSLLTFTTANWNVAQAVTVTASNDNVVEGNHSGTLGFAVASTDPAYGSITLPTITASITDNDTATVSFAPASVSQGEATSPMVYTVTLSNPVASGVTVTVNSTNGTATAGADYTAIADQTVTFAPGSTTAQTVSVAVTNDALDEDNETYTLTLSALSATGDVTLGTATAIGTIEDDDALPVLSVANVSQPEGNAVNTLTFTVNLSPVSGRAVSFTRATVDGTAISTGPNADFVAIAGSMVTIPAGQTSLTIPVTINGDTVFEGDEQFTLSLTDIANANVGGTTIAGSTANLSATATLLEDDQQPTTTTITADLPDPSVVGQPYPVTVEVRGQTLSPLGTVEVTDGTGASCNATLTTGTAPVSTMTCALTSTSAGNKTLTARYTPASSAFGASSDTESHTVSGASTSMVLLGPARARIGTAASYTAELSVTAPGTGTPAGTVTVTAGASSCTITLPTATPSCSISYSSLGSRTVTAVFAPGNSDYSGSTSNPVQTLVFASADLSVTKTNAVNTYRPGDLLVYTVVVRNTGPDAAPQVRVRDVAPAGLTNVAWTCEASGGAVCPDAGGTGTLDHVVETLPSTGVLTYAYFGNVIGRPLSIVNVAEVMLPADTTIEDPNLANNSASDTDLLDDLFANGFEAPEINGATGSQRLPAASLRSTQDEVARVTVRLSDLRGEALRVYTRVIGGELQVALAVRGADGSLRLGAWQRSSGEPELVWTATSMAGGFVLSGAELR